MKIRPTQDRVHFERVVQTFTKKEIVTEYQPSLRCKVIATGPRCQHVKAGMTVLVALNVGMPVEGVDGRFCREDDILAILNQ